MKELLSDKNMILSPSTNCPKCSAALVTDGFEVGKSVVCSACRHLFVWRPQGFAVQASGKARASLMLGIASMLGMCLTGIPAIVLGAVALHDIRLAAGALTGRKLAIWGIFTGATFGLICTVLTPALLLPVIQWAFGQ